MHDRLAGVPPSAAVLDQMAALIRTATPSAAANIAMQAPSFYNVTLKNWVTPWTNRDQTVFAPLNDYTATVIGMVRDDVDFRTVLSADMLYVGGSGLPAYSPANNNLYQQLEDQDVDLGDPACWWPRRSPRTPALPAAGHRRRDDHARRGAGVLRRRHQPRDVPLHDDEPPVQGHGAGARRQRCRRIASART